MSTTNNVNETHPAHDAQAPNWKVVRDTYAGEKAVKDAGTEYLPPTEGMELDGMSTGQLGLKRYNAYKKRARFPGLMRLTISGMLGMMHRKSPNISLPARLEDMQESATARGESLPLLLRRINEMQLLFGRVGLLTDVPTTEVAQGVPYISTYTGPAIINWDDGRVEQGQQQLALVVLDESEYERDGFSWDWVQKHTALMLSEGRYVAQRYRNLAPEGDEVVPQFAGNTMTKLPFSFVNTMDLVPTPAEPPLLELANLCLSIYRAEADYRQHLHAQSQDTLVVIGADEDDNSLEAGAEAGSSSGALRTGTGSAIYVPLQGDAKFIGARSEGLSEERSALENDYKMAVLMGAQLMTQGGSQEAAEALRIRVGSRTASLVTIARVGAEGAAQSLRRAAEFVGADPDEVQVEPNLDWTEEPMGAKELLDLVQSKLAGAPMSWESIHRRMEQGELTDLDYDEERDRIDEEEAAAGGL